jgi:hypothetical protein
VRQSNHSAGYSPSASSKCVAASRSSVSRKEYYYGELDPFVAPLPSMSGLHLAGLLPREFRVPDLIARSAATGVGLYAIEPFYQRDGQPGLLFGFGSCTTPDIKEGNSPRGERRSSKHRRTMMLCMQRVHTLMPAYTSA